MLHSSLAKPENIGFVPSHTLMVAQVSVIGLDVLDAFWVIVTFIFP